MTNEVSRRFDRKALVIGGGVAGIAAALALKKAGLTPLVYEAHARTADGVGAFLTLAVNGLEALSAIDVDVTRLGGFETPRMELFLGDGRHLTSFDFGPRNAGRPVGRTIRRADLYTALRTEAASRGIEVTYGKQLLDARSDGDRVVATFADGSTSEGDLLIAADGLRSRVRRIVDPKAPEARFVGLLNAGGFARGLKVEGEVGTMRMYFGKRCFFTYVPTPTGEVWWFANPSRAKAPTSEELAAITEDAWRAELHETFREDATPACAIIDASPEIFAGWPTFDFPRVPVWHRDRMLLIGDAAHAASPSSGQGASMAIEDGVTLGKILRDENDVSVAFARYEACRRARVEKVVAMGKQSGDGKTPGRFGRVVRDLGLRMVFSRPQPDRTAWLYETPMQWA